MFIAGCSLWPFDHQSFDMEPMCICVRAVQLHGVHQSIQNCEQVSLLLPIPSALATQYYYILFIHFIPDLITVIDGLWYYLIRVCAGKL